MRGRYAGSDRLRGYRLKKARRRFHRRDQAAEIDRDVLTLPDQFGRVVEKRGQIAKRKVKGRAARGLFQRQRHLALPGCQNAAHHRQDDGVWSWLLPVWAAQARAAGQPKGLSTMISAGCRLTRHLSDQPMLRRRRAAVLARGADKLVLRAPPPIRTAGSGADGQSPTPVCEFSFARRVLRATNRPVDAGRRIMAVESYSNADRCADRTRGAAVGHHRGYLFSATAQLSGPGYLSGSARAAQHRSCLAVAAVHRTHLLRTGSRG